MFVDAYLGAARVFFREKGEEQYKDFLLNQTFRSSLLCHQDIVLNRQFTPDNKLLQKVISGLIRPVLFLHFQPYALR